MKQAGIVAVGEMILNVGKSVPEERIYDDAYTHGVYSAILFGMGILAREREQPVTELMNAIHYKQAATE